MIELISLYKIGVSSLFSKFSVLGKFGSEEEISHGVIAPLCYFRIFTVKRASNIFDPN